MGHRRTINLPSGGKPGSARRERAFFVRDFERRHGHPPQAPPSAPGARIRYQVMSEVPEHWIPMIPVHIAGDNREVQLQRAAMVRILDATSSMGVSVSTHRPRTSAALAWTVPVLPRIIHEEEARAIASFSPIAARAGAMDAPGVARCRGRSWRGLDGLAFDRIVDETGRGMVSTTCLWATGGRTSSRSRLKPEL
jgi:hypothetical protein